MSAPAPRQLTIPEHTNLHRVRPSVIRVIALLATAPTRDSLTVISSSSYSACLGMITTRGTSGDRAYVCVCMCVCVRERERENLSHIRGSFTTLISKFPSRVLSTVWLSFVRETVLYRVTL